MDAKRGDIGSTAEAYARSYLYPESPCPVDALTVNPYLGVDSLSPFIKAAAHGETGLFVLAKTSNRGSGEFQDLSTDGARLFQKVACALRPHADALVGTSGWSSIGIVAGATFPADAMELRKSLPNSLFLIPGFGAQGGQLQSAFASFVHGDANLEGGLISSSRGILFGDDSASRAEDWRGAFRARLQLTINQLSDVVQGTNRRMPDGPLK